MTQKIWTLLDILQLSTKYLTENTIENARLNAEMLISHVLKLSRVQLYLNFERPLTDKELELIRSLLKRRAHHEPIQYIIGETEFYSLKFKVNRSTLIPRPETEILVEKIIEKCSTDREISILDIGAGCGNISIAIAKNLPNTRISGIDVQREAVIIAHENAVLNNVEDRVQFQYGDIFDSGIAQYLNQKFDIVVSNPPYVSATEFAQLPPEIKEYEPYIALSDGEDGLMFYRRITEILENLLCPAGIIVVEVDESQAKKVKDIFLQKRLFKSIEIINDLNGTERAIIAWTAKD